MILEAVKCIFIIININELFLYIRLYALILLLSALNDKFKKLEKYVFQRVVDLKKYNIFLSIC